MRSTDLSWDEQARADAGRPWAGGVVTAVVAAGVALVAVMVSHKLMHVTLLTDGTREAADDAMVMLPLLAAIVTLFATGLLHLLMTTTPRAPQFFAWIGALVMVLILLQVYVSTSDDVTGRLATGALYLLIGVVIISSLSGVGRTAVRYHRHQAFRENDGYREDAYRYEHEPRRYR